jgi:hypothetical protein
VGYAWEIIGVEKFVGRALRTSWALLQVYRIQVVLSAVCPFVVAADFYA